MPMPFELGFMKVQDTMLSVLQRQSIIIIVTVFWLLQSAFMLGLPWLSNWANAMYGSTKPQGWQKEGLCHLPPSEYKCHDGANLAALLIQAGRTSLCGCGQGVFGEGICDIRGTGFTLSDYIATSPANGLFTAVSTVPLLAMYGGHAAAAQLFGSDTGPVRFARLGLLVIHAGFLGIVSLPVCQTPAFHGAAVMIFYLSLMLHFISLAVAACRTSERSTTAVIIIAVTVLANLSFFGAMLLTSLYVMNPIKYSALSKMFWLGEAVALMLVFGTAPLVCQLRVCGAAGRVLEEASKPEETATLLNGDGKA